MMRYFGEDPIDKSARSAFFRRFVDFMTQYQTAKKENLEKEEAKRKDEARKRVLGTANTPTKASSGQRDAKTVEANSKIMDDLLDKLRSAPKDSARHQRRRAARRNVSGATTKGSLVRIVSMSSEAVSNHPQESIVVPSVTVDAPEKPEDDGELDLGKVAQGLLSGLRGGDDLLASFREARKSVNAGMNVQERKSEDSPQSPVSLESLLKSSTDNPKESS